MITNPTFSTDTQRTNFLHGWLQYLSKTFLFSLLIVLLVKCCQQPVHALLLPQRLTNQDNDTKYTFSSTYFHLHCSSYLFFIHNMFSQKYKGIDEDTNKIKLLNMYSFLLATTVMAMQALASQLQNSEQKCKERHAWLKETWGVLVLQYLVCDCLMFSNLNRFAMTGFEPDLDASNALESNRLSQLSFIRTWWLFSQDQDDENDNADKMYFIYGLCMIFEVIFFKWPANSPIIFSGCCDVHKGLKCQNYSINKSIGLMHHKITGSF